MASIRHGGFVPRPSDPDVGKKPLNRKSKGVAEASNPTSERPVRNSSEPTPPSVDVPPVHIKNNVLEKEFKQMALTNVAVELGEEEEEYDGGRDSDLDEDEVQLADTTPAEMMLDEIERPGLWTIKKKKNLIFVIDPFQRTKVSHSQIFIFFCYHVS